MRGIYYKCTEKICFDDFNLCFKCITYEYYFHDASHQFRKIEPEFEDHEQNDESETTAPTAVKREVSLEPTVEEIHTWDSYMTVDDL